MALLAMPMRTHLRELSEAARAPMSICRLSTTPPLSARLTRVGLLVEAGPAATQEDPEPAADPDPEPAPTFVLPGEYIVDLVAFARG